MPTETEMTYSQNCGCSEINCRCTYFCRPIDGGVCDFCANGWHAHFDHIYYGSDCSMCGMPSHMESAFPKRHGMNEKQAYEWGVRMLETASASMRQYVPARNVRPTEQVRRNLSQG